MRIARIVTFFLPLLLLAAPAMALRVQDITRLKSEIPNELTGIGLEYDDKISGCPGGPGRGQ